MGLQQRLELRQGQSLVMTPQLLQAIKLLQLSHIDLVSYVDAELERNPLLEVAAPQGDVDDRSERDGAGDPSLLAGDPVGDSESFGFDEGSSADNWSPGEIEGPRGVIEADGSAPLDNVYPDEPISARDGDASDQLSLASSSWQSSGGSFDGEPFDVTATLATEQSLHEHLADQLHLATTDPVRRLVGRHLIDAVNEAGYLAEDPVDLAERLGVEPRLVLRVLSLIQTFTPSGIAARDLAECLAIQLAERDRYDPAMRAMVGRLDLVAKRDLPALKRLCGVDDEDLAAMLAELRELEPKPGRAFGSGPVNVLVPDVFVRPAPDGSWNVELNPDTLPRVLVNQAFHARVSKSVKNDVEKSYISECLQSANWLTRSLEQRSKTILKVASEIVRQQDGFFLKGVSQLRPAQPEDHRGCDRHARVDRLAGHVQQVDRDGARHVRDEVLLHRLDSGGGRDGRAFLGGGATPHPPTRRCRAAGGRPVG
jgi:RNA polymerase sigma-54 factor